MNNSPQEEKLSRAIRNASDKFRSILEEAPIGMYQASPDGQIVYANSSFATMLGYSNVDELITSSSKNLQGIYCTNQDRLNHLEAIYSGFSGATMEMCLTTAKRGKIWASVQSRGVRGKNGEPLYHDVFVTDISEKKQLQAEAIRASQLASLGELAASVAHEINNPLNAVLNFAQLLEDEPEGQGRLDLLARLQREGNRIAVIVRNLLSFARAENENFSPVCLRDVINDSLGLTRALLEKDGILIAVDIPDNIPLIRGRFQELQQVCINLLNNAKHALTERFPLPHPEKKLVISARLISSTQTVEFKVRDSGQGILPDLLESVAEPFFSTKPKGVGTGLGLSISNKIIKAHKGQLYIASKPGQFTEVSMSLPVWQEKKYGKNSGR